MKRAIKKNKESEIDVDVTDMDLLGFGEAEFETMTLKIPGGTIGDRLSVSVVHKSPHQPVAWCDVHVVHKRGAFFQTPACPHAWPVNGRCGGCPLLHVNFEKAAELKQQKVVHALDENGCRAKVHWNPSPSRRNYRNRGHFVVAKQGGQTILGAYAPRSHDVVSMKNCLVLQAPMERVATDMERIFSSSRYPVYPEEKGIRYVTIRADKDGAVWVDWWCTQMGHI